MSKNNPCYKCEDRHLSCHSNCADYLAFRKELDKEAEIKRKYNAELSYFMSHKKNR